LRADSLEFNKTALKLPTQAKTFVDIVTAPSQAWVIASARCLTSFVQDLEDRCYENTWFLPGLVIPEMDLNGKVIWHQLD